MKSEALSLRSGRLRSFSEDHRKSCYLVMIYCRCFKTRNEHKCFDISISRRTSCAGGDRVTFDGQGGMRGVYLLVKTAIYYCAMPNNKRPEGVSDLVTRMPQISQQANRTLQAELHFLYKFTFESSKGSMRTDVL